MPEEDQTIFDQYQWKNLKQIESDGWYLFALTEEGHVISTFDQVSFFAFDGAKQSCPNHNFPDKSGNIRADGFSPYASMNAEDVAAVCGGIYVDGDGTLHSVMDAEADKPLPVFDLER